MAGGGGHPSKFEALHSIWLIDSQEEHKATNKHTIKQTNKKQKQTKTNKHNKQTKQNKTNKQNKQNKTKQNKTKQINEQQNQPTNHILFHLC